MDVMGFMEAMGTSNIPLVAAFFIGLMMAISPCPLVTNITAIAYVSKKIGSGNQTLITGLVYTAGRMITYVAIASLIVFTGLTAQAIALPLQQYGDLLLGPLFLVIGILMLDVISFPTSLGGGRVATLRENLSDRGHAGSFLLGALFALSFCPFSAVLFFGMLIPLAIRAGDGIIIPAIFAFATGLPVILLSLVLVTSVGRLGSILKKIQTFELWTRRIAGVIFIVAGIYFCILLFS